MPHHLTVNLVAGGAPADAAYAVLDVRAPAGTALPPHVAANEDGTLIVLEGDLEVVLDGERRRLGPGELLSLPRSRPRRLCAVADTRVLVLTVPAGIERLADLVADPVADRDDLAAILAAAGVSLLPVGWGATAV